MIQALIRIFRSRSCCFLSCSCSRLGSGRGGRNRHANCSPNAVSGNATSMIVSDCKGDRFDGCTIALNNAALLLVTELTSSETAPSREISQALLAHPSASDANDNSTRQRSPGAEVDEVPLGSIHWLSWAAYCSHVKPPQGQVVFQARVPRVTNTSCEIQYPKLSVVNVAKCTVWQDTTNQQNS